MSYRTACTCGHDRDTHYKDPSTSVRHSCLARGCECLAYRDELFPAPLKPAPRPAINPPAPKKEPPTYPYTKHGIIFHGPGTGDPDDDPPDTPAPITWPNWP